MISWEKDGRYLMSASARKAELERVAAKIEKADSERRAWNRLCGSAAPIGRAVELPSS